MASNHYPAWQRRHEAVLQYMLEHPGARYREISRVTGYSETHLSRIVNSPEFYRRYRAHRDAVLKEAARRIVFSVRRQQAY
jgi:AraC-like DNA-binding protein